MLAARTDPWDVTTQPSAEVFAAAKKDEARKAAGCGGARRSRKWWATRI